jgi:tRNA threonylcarbamoyladenosine biosynthesis protein TsaB
MILLLETSTLNCSVALGTPDGRCIQSMEESSSQYLHAERLHVLIDQLLKSVGTSRHDLTAVAVGRGPGSFTGLRIGVSAAKGICTGLSLPLLAPCPLKALRNEGMATHPEWIATPERIVPAIDARRMELYTLDRDDQPEAAEVDSGFRRDLGTGPALLIGDGAEKCRDILAEHPTDWQFLQCFPNAASLLPEAVQQLSSGQAQNVADFEPFYLKDFKPGRPKDPLGLRTPTP